MALDYNVTLFSLVFMRMSGCVLLNPVFGRRNLPVILKIGLSIFLTLFVYGLAPQQTVEINSFLVYGVVMVKELLVGFAAGFVMQLFFSVIILGGEVMDMQIGISMSKIYDPQSNVSMPVTASLLNVMQMLLFFSANGHVAMMSIFAQLGVVIPYGDNALPPDMFKEMTALFSVILIYALKLALPLLAVEVITEISVGLLMKAVPQINIFVLNLQLKIFVGFFVMLLLVPAYSAFLERLINLMFDQVHHMFRYMAAAP